MSHGADELKALVRTIADFPKPGVQFRDVTTLLLDRDGFACAVDFYAPASRTGSTWSRRSRRAASPSAGRWRNGWARACC